LGVRVDLPGSAHLVLAGPVGYLDPAPAVFDAMVTGWAVRQRSRFLTERTVAGRVWVVRRLAGFTGLYPWQWGPAEVEAFFAGAREQAGLPGELDLHCLRHSYVSHLIEFGYPPLFVQQQAGHAVASTTAICTSVSGEFRNRLLEQAVSRQRQAGTTS
jgi:site-specific recombinase XerD